MVSFPVFRHLEVIGYGLFPGATGDHRLSFSFDRGVSLIVGVNGLGKTTLVTMLLRSLTGPFDLQQSGALWALGAILNENPVRLDRETLGFFSQRVADGASDASMTVTVSFGHDSLRITRQLDNLRLTTLELNGEPVFLSQATKDREIEFQRIVCERMSLTSFVDVLLVLHYVVFLAERRPGALWDENAQRQLLRATLLKPDLAASIPTLERRVSQTDGEFRRARYEANKYEKRLRDAQAQAKVSPAIRAQLQATQKSLDADRKRLAEIEELLLDLDQQRRNERLRFERAKVVREESEAVLERQKYATLLRLFPSMDDAARLTIIRVLSDDACLVCGSRAEGKRRELEKLLKEGLCPACGSHSLSKGNIVPAEKVASARLDQLVKQATLAAAEAQHSSAALDKIMHHYDGLVKKAISLRTEIEDREAAEQGLVAQLPKSSKEISELENAVSFLRNEEKENRAKSLEARSELSDAYASAKRSFAQRTKGLAEIFSQFTSMMIAEEAKLVRGPTSATITQDGDDFEVYGFIPEMTAADRPGRARRDLPNDVSESQREIIDLAFRIALISIAGQGGSATLVMETPEASLDAIAMDRVGHALSMFAHADNNHLITTNNLTNTQMISALFGGSTKSQRALEERKRRTLNLLNEAAPNRALEKDRKRYLAILERALGGTTA